MIQVNNLIRGKIISGRQNTRNTSPVNGAIISQVNFLSKKDLIDVFAHAKKMSGSEDKKSFVELSKLARYLDKNRLKFITQIIAETGFTHKDAEDLVQGSVEFCRDYHLYLKQIATSDIITSFDYNKTSHKRIKLTSLPYGLISASTPRNTPLITELIVIVHALWSGNRLVLRPSFGDAGTIALLIEGLKNSFNSKTLMNLNIVFSEAKDFVEVSLDYSNLLHYIGSTKYLEHTLIAGIKKGVKVLVDGDGCSLILIDSTADLEKAASSCYQALVRCNGQICISARVVVVEESVYDKFLKHFLPLIKKTIVEPPVLNKRSTMGPVFSSAQAENILAIAKRCKLIEGQISTLNYGKNYITPFVVKLKPTDKTFLRERLFGPMVGVSYYKGDGWKRWLEENPINLTDVIFSNNKKIVKEFLTTSKSPRKVINADPTLESIFEPWGAFLPSGWNDVSHWYYKYRNYYQLVEHQ